MAGKCWESLHKQTFDPLRIDEQPDVPVLLPITDYSLPRLLAVQRIRCGVDGNIGKPQIQCSGNVDSEYTKLYII